MADKVIWGLVLEGQGPVVQLGAEEVRGLGWGGGGGGGGFTDSELAFQREEQD